MEHPYHSSRQVGGLTHTLYRYPARFSPLLVSAALDAFTVPGDTVLDPFMGGGTTAVEALARGRRFVGFDINPLAVLLTAGKTTPIGRRELAALAKWVTQPGVPSAGSETDDPRLLNAPEDLVAWLAPRVATVAELPTRRLQDAARLLLLDASQTAVDGRQTPAEPEYLGRALLRSLGRYAEGLAAFRQSALAHGVAPWEIPRRRVLRLGSAADLAASRGLNRVAGRARLVVTSPPYPAVHVLYHRWQVRGRAETALAYWLADQRDGLGPKHYTMGGRSALGEDTYFRATTDAWASLRRLLAPDAIVLQLIAFARPELQLPRYLDAMKAAGYTRRLDLEPSGWREVPNRRWYYRVQPSRGRAQEALLVHEPA